LNKNHTDKNEIYRPPTYLGLNPKISGYYDQSGDDEFTEEEQSSSEPDPRNRTELSFKIDSTANHNAGINPEQKN
jgi:hypothetical protein